MGQMGLCHLCKHQRHQVEVVEVRILLGGSLYIAPCGLFTVVPKITKRQEVFITCNRLESTSKHHVKNSTRESTGVLYFITAKANFFLVS